MTQRRKTWLAALAAIVLVPVAVLYALLSSSLPRRNGAAELPGLSATVEVELDVHAVPRLRGASLEDALSALGFMHAQERFFQMDLTRRSAAGELAALVGPRALPADRAQRPYELRRRAAAWLARLPAEHRSWLEAYVRGVNAGLSDLRAAPPEYLLLRERPEPWTAEDSLLVAYAVCMMLSENQRYEKPLAVMRAALPTAVYAFLTPSTTRFDRPVVYPRDDRSGGYVPMAIPDARVLDLRELRAPDPDRRVVDSPLAVPGSNQWAAGASRSARGDALLANDPHLQLKLPNTFYRAELYWPGHAVRGAGIPGLPGILIGASGTLAWGATVSYADQSDWIVVEVDEHDAGRYRTAEGLARFGTATYEIAVAGVADPERLEVRTTQWGPVLDADGLGRPLVLEATWLAEGGMSLDVLELMRADSVARGLAVVSRWAGPSLNWMLADSRGAIGWGFNGPVPRRSGFDGSVPEPRSDGTRRWSGFVPLPSVGPHAQVLFTANQRTLPHDEAVTLSRLWMRPLRARRIGELLDANARFTESDFLAMQLDTRAQGYEPIRDLVLEVVPAGEADAGLAWARRTAETWNGYAEADTAGFRLMQGFYRVLLERALAPLLAPVFEADPSFVYRWPLADESLSRILEERPPHMLTADYADWPAFFRAALIATLERLAVEDGGLSASWGRANRLDVAHPFANVPVLGRRLRLPAHEQSGSMVSLRVAAPRYGAALRMIVSPAHPESGFLQMPGGQSGHLLSRHLADLHADWANGAPTPFLAGPTQWRFRLVGDPSASRRGALLL
jgi:penicillin amidase